MGRQGIGVLRNAIPKRPVFPCHLDEVDEDIFFAYALLSHQELGDSSKKRLLLLHRTARGQSNLDDHNPVRSLDIEIGRIVNQVGLMLSDYLKAIAFGYPYCFHHGPMHTIGDAMALLL